MLTFEFLSQEIDDAVVEVFATKERIAVGCLDFKHAVADFEDRHVERTATEVIDRDDAVALFIEAVGEGGSRRFVDDAQDVEAGDFTGVLGCLTLGVVEVSRDRDDGLVDFFAEMRLGSFFHFLQYHCRDLRRGHFLAIDFNPCVAVVATDNRERGKFCHLLDFGVVETTAKKTLDTVEGFIGVGDSLAFCGLADEAFAVLGEGDDRRGGAHAFRVFDDFGLVAFHDGNARVRGAEVDADDFT